jgi:hypothetical protein
MTCDLHLEEAGFFRGSVYHDGAEARLASEFRFVFYS